MATLTLKLQEDYWENFDLQEDDTEFIYNYLLELETPLTTADLVTALIKDRINRERVAIEKRSTSGGELYQPKGTFEINQTLVFPAFNWQWGKVIGIRDGSNPDLGEFKVIQVEFNDGNKRELASELENHTLNEPPKIAEDDPQLNPELVEQNYSDKIIELVEEDLISNPDFVRIAGKWFPRTLLVDINTGHLNIAEAVLDMNNGGPATTSELLEQIDLKASVNPKLLDFSLDLALQEDERFDEVGPAGDVLWFLKRLEPTEVLETPIFLRYKKFDYDRDILTPEMLDLERDLDDELSPIPDAYIHQDSVDVTLIFPHLHAGTLPLSARINHLFPTAYEAPRIRFTIVDGTTGEKFPAWVVREQRYVFGLKEWYKKNNLIPGSIFTVKRGEIPGEVIVQTKSKRTSRDWIKTVLVGSDGGVVFAMLKQLINGNVDERRGIAVPDPEALDEIWVNLDKANPPFEQIVVNTFKELAKLNPQSNVHASELYAAINITRRYPPGPILALLASRPWFIHVGDLHFKLSEQEI
jgi:hypothetical protein